VYLRSDVDLFGMPEHYGVWDYLLIDDVVEYVAERAVGERVTAVRKHEYSRFERFDTLVRNLCGIGKVPLRVMEYVEDNLWDVDRDTVWESIQKLLRVKKWGRFGNRIPIMLREMGFADVVVMKAGISVDHVILRFREMSRKFDRMSKEQGWTYFPNMRYCALRLMIMMGVTFNYRVPLVKTDSKIKVLDRKFNVLFF